MSSFTTEPKLEFIGRYRFKLLESFDFHVGEYPSADVISVPVGFETDLASVPRALWSILPPHGKWTKAAIIHDYLYATGSRSRAESDKIFLEGMEVLGVEKTRRTLMYWAVRLFGGSRYRND